MKRLGEILVEAGAITERARDEALVFTKANGVMMGTALLESGALPEGLLLRALSVQSFSPPADAHDLESIPADVVALVPGQVAKKYSVIPFRKAGRTLHLAMTCPWDSRAAAEVEFLAGLTVLRHVAVSARITEALERYYGVSAPSREQALVKRLDRSIAAASPEVLSPGPPPADAWSAPSDPAVPGGSDESLFETVRMDHGQVTSAAVLAALPAIPEERLADLPGRLGRARSRGEIGAALLAVLGPRLRTAALFAAHGGRLFGWMAVPEPLGPFAALSLGLSEVPTFAALREPGSFFSGLLPYTPANRRILEALAIRFPAVIGVVPVVTCGGPELYLLAEASGGTNDLPMPLLRRCAAMAATALEIFALRTRLRREDGIDQPAS
jgi:hypothetical protein